LPKSAKTSNKKKDFEHLWPIISITKLKADPYTANQACATAVSATSPPNLKKNYRDVAVKILNSLSSPAYIADGTNSMGILLHGTTNGTDPAEGETDVSLIYGDHFYIEALLRYKKLCY